MTEMIKEARNKAIEKPEWFFNEVLRFPALPWQLEAINAVLDIRREVTKVNHDRRPRVTIRSCHGTGKTQLLAMLMHIWNFTTYGKIACTAPKQQQLTKRLLPRYRSAARDALGFYKDMIKVLGQEIIIGNDKDWGAVLETASDPESLAGFHDNPQLFVVDEASGKKLDPMYPTIEGALTTKGSCIVEIGNPTRVEGEFYKHHMDRSCKDLYYRMHIKPDDAKEIISQDWLKSMETKYGKNSPIYLIRAQGEFASYDDYVLIQLDDFEEAIDAAKGDDGSHPRIRVSIDVADGGADSTVITVAKHYDSHVEILHQKAHWFKPSESPLEAAKAGLRVFEAYGGRKPFDDFVVDAMGVGSGTAGYLMQEGYNVIRHVGGESSDFQDRFRNRRVQNYITLYEHFRDGKISIDSEGVDNMEELRAHLFSIKRRITTEKVDDIETKNSIKAAGLDSPDRADSLSMQMIDRTEIAHIDYSDFGLIGSMQSVNYG